MSWTISDFKTYLNTPKKILLTSHLSPDGDAIGSVLAMKGLLEQLGHEVTAIVPDAFPDFLKWLNGYESILIYTENNGLAKRKILEADLSISLDYNGFKRIGDMGNILKKTSIPKLLIDHHQQPEDFAVLQYCDVKASSTAQLVYDLICEMEYQNLITKAMAEAMYTGIMTDTGSFRFPVTTAKTHKTIAHLLECGATPHEIHSNIFDSNEADRLKLLGFALSEKMVYNPKRNTAYFALSLSELERFNFQRGYTEGLVNYGLSIKGVKFSCLITEREDIIKMSFRSKGEFDVNQFARTYFNGGGHKNAAGGKSDVSLAETIEALENALSSEEQKLM